MEVCVRVNKSRRTGNFTVFGKLKILPQNWGCNKIDCGCVLRWIMCLMRNQLPDCIHVNPVPYGLISSRKQSSTPSQTHFSLNPIYLKGSYFLGNAYHP